MIKTMRVRIFYLKKRKWRKGRENEYERIVYVDKFKSNICVYGKYKYVRRKKLIRIRYVVAI